MELIQAAPLSPCAVLLIFQSQGEGVSTEAYCSLAQGLASTVICQSAQFNAIQHDQAATMDKE